MVTRNFVDEEELASTAPRPLRTAIWYPAAVTATKEETIFGGAPAEQLFARIVVAPDAEISRAIETSEGQARC
jgi:hypothetical protein